MRFFFSVQDMVYFFVGAALPMGHAVRTVYLPDPFPGGYPSPSRGYFGRKVFVFNSLPGVAVCKILTANELPAKYCIETS